MAFLRLYGQTDKLNPSDKISSEQGKGRPKGLPFCFMQRMKHLFFIFFLILVFASSAWSVDLNCPGGRWVVVSSQQDLTCIWDGGNTDIIEGGTRHIVTHGNSNGGGCSTGTAGPCACLIKSPYGRNDCVPSGGTCIDGTCPVRPSSSHFQPLISQFQKDFSSFQRKLFSLSSLFSLFYCNYPANPLFSQN